MPKHTNRLIKEKSPYLLQHAHNPVDWYPWGEEAFAKAKNENKPVFLSVGYSTCHWCHVMEHESFENEEIAKIMNKYFVNIKVDREENPGVDKLYMTYIQLTSGHGGWPMSIFLTPDLDPFFGASYFPPEDQYGSPGFKTLLNRIGQLWETNPEKVKASGKSMIQQLKSYIQAKPADASDALDPTEIAEETFQHFEDSFDSVYGGFGKAPKFPTPVQIQFLFNYYMYNRQNEDNSANAQKALDMALFTLKKIAAGGIHDHVGNGFHRYSTDKKWHVPHFEKMLYDQAQLLSLYSFAYQITENPVFADITRDIILYVSRDLHHTSGGFYSAEDADSLPHNNATKKLEGAFCVWELSELKEILGTSDSHVFAIHYGCSEKGNVNPAQDPHKELVHKNVLYNKNSIEETAKMVDMSPTEVQSILHTARSKLWNYRATVRPKPHRDEKIITSWNGLMITGLVHAYEALQNESIIKLATETAEFIYRELYNPSTHTLLRSFCDGPSNIEGFVDDYCFLIQALLDLYEATFDERWIEWAFELQEKQNELFYDNEEGGYFNVTVNDKSILIRMKEEQDGAEPSANSIALKNLIRLSSLLGISSYHTKAQDTVQSFRLTLSQYPFALPALVDAFTLLSKGLKEIVLAGKSTDPELKTFTKIISRLFLPNKLVILTKPNGFISTKNSIVKEIAENNVNKPAVYICENFTCGLPIYDAEQLEQALNGYK
ncbi:spermatogenesis-associated protein 20 [Cokeromyces recurvatus]|uniref:spermatogenesis-associated protein 20 n=1 Tax=Cokeromyces recurvatus TaxID=90255 RepID=UPI00221F344B|nr:spermatogenesis-associated protein 20 [Cokeromyces recurvatus]KAI7906412.1 spermatogenesis-associated protein 20 [Cokeromyces recurvatus]